MTHFFESPLVDPPQDSNISPLKATKNEENNQVVLSNQDMSQAQLIIKEWLNIDDEIEKLNKALRERKKKKKELQEYITNFMKSKEIPHFNINDGQLILTETKHKKPLSKTLLFSLCHKYFNNNSNQANNLVDFIQDNRGSSISNKLKRKKNKK